MMTAATPEHYLMMIGRFKNGIDTTADPRNAFRKGTPQWMIDEWVEFNTTSFVDF